VILTDSLLLIVMAREPSETNSLTWNNIMYRVAQKKIARSLAHRHFATVCSRITRFSPECSGKIIVYQSMHNLYQLVKYSLINNRNWIHVASEVTLHVNTPLTVEYRLLIKTLQTGWIVEKRLLSFRRDSGNGKCCLLSYD